jgi:hypothetical protein
MAGLPPDDFWSKTFAEVRFIVRATVRRVEQDYERQRAVAYEAAKLTALAFHNPKKLPDYKPLEREKPKLAAPTEYDNARVKAFFVELAARGKRSAEKT